jgi:glycolate oxidase FAD binding subunit
VTDWPGIVGREFAAAGEPEDRVDGIVPSWVVRPGSVGEIRAVVGTGARLVASGLGAHLDIGAPPEAFDVLLRIDRLDRVLDHQAADMTVTAEAGCSLAMLQKTLARAGQWLPLDPPRCERTTIGGLVAANLSGPLRASQGTVRDLLLGLTVVGAGGVVVRSGGRVVKNVAGYDLPKLFIGSYGTLGVIVEATVKLRPVPEQEELVSVRFDRLKDAGSAVKAVAASDLIPNAVELLDGAGASGAGLAAGSPAPGGVLVVGFDGVREQVDWQRAELARLTGPLGGRDPRLLDATAWTRLPTAAREAFSTTAAVMTLVVLPSQVAEIMEQGAGIARGRGLQSAWAAHAGVGVVRGALASEPAPKDPAALAVVLAEWREMARAGGGYANLEWAPLAIKSQIPVWDDPGAAGRIMERIKAQLDPRNILNPGRFVAGI